MDSRRIYAGFRIDEVVRENSATTTLILDGELGADPGQFVMLWVPGVDEKPFSLSGDCPVRLTIREVGPVSRYLCGLPPGEEVRLRGPFGRGFVLRGSSPLLVGGGYGAAPLGFLARKAVERGATCVLAVGAASAEELLVPQDLDDRVEILTATEDGSAGVQGYVTKAAEAVVDRGTVDGVYACGPEGMLASVKSLCVRRGIQGQLCYEAYMRCGVGVCGSCEHEGKLVCRDGPVIGC